MSYRTMNNAGSEQIGSEIISYGMSDEALEAAGSAINSRAAITLFASCTISMCPIDMPADSPWRVRPVDKG
jgi:hypothetical protein